MREFTRGFAPAHHLFRRVLEGQAPTERGKTAVGPLFPLAPWRLGVPMPWTDDEAGIAVDGSRPLVLYQVDADVRLYLRRVADDVQVLVAP